jgi:hypothetical protein
LTAYHDEGADVDHVGAPIPGMVDLARRFLDDGVEVRIITARVAPEYDDNEEQRAIIRAWCIKHLGTVIPVQAHKCGRMERLYDDRAYGVQRNTGVLSTDYSQALGVVIGESNIKVYDRKYGLEDDAQAFLVEDCDDRYNICVRSSPFLDGEDDFFLDVREARCLAASLLRACDEAEKKEAE